MDVFIGNLPASTSFNEIRELHGSWDFDVPVKRVDGEGRNGNAFHYFLARFSLKDEAEADRLIQDMTGLSCYGRVLDVREFVHRACSSERRALNWRDKPWHKPERRVNERREGRH